MGADRLGDLTGPGFAAKDGDKRRRVDYQRGLPRLSYSRESKSAIDGMSRALPIKAFSAATRASTVT